MTVIRAHFDGSVIVPDEPITLPPQSKVMILLDSSTPATAAELETQTREYYQGESHDELDDAWGEGVARGNVQAWDEKLP